MSPTRDDLRGVSRVSATVPGEQSARGVASHGVEFLAQYFATYGETLFGVA